MQSIQHCLDDSSALADVISSQSVDLLLFRELTRLVREAHEVDCEEKREIKSLLLGVLSIQQQTEEFLSLTPSSVDCESIVGLLKAVEERHIACDARIREIVNQYNKQLISQQAKPQPPANPASHRCLCFYCIQSILLLFGCGFIVLLVVWCHYNASLVPFSCPVSCTQPNRFSLPRETSDCERRNEPT